MGFLDSLMGRASEVDASKMHQEFASILVEGERIEKAYQVFRDSYLFTDRRLILVDKQGMTGKKIEYHSIPYQNITHFSIETAGSFDYDAELKIWISGGDKISKEFNKKLSVRRGKDGRSQPDDVAAVRALRRNRASQIWRWAAGVRG